MHVAYTLKFSVVIWFNVIEYTLMNMDTWITQDKKEVKIQSYQFKEICDALQIMEYKVEF